MTRYKHIALDIDNTLTDLSFTLDTMATLHHKPRIGLDKALSFRLAELFDLTLEEESAFWETQESNIVDLSVLSDERVNTLLSAYTDADTQIYLVSNRPERFARQTEIWAERHGLPFDGVYCIGKQDKAKWIHENLPEVEAVFEDNPAFFEQAESYDFDTYCIDYPYNERINTLHRLCRDTGEPI